MTNQDYLIQRGWREDRTCVPFKWSDPENRETRYTLEDAFEKQAHREAARLHTALDALELALPILNEQSWDSFAAVDSTQPDGLSEFVVRNRQARDAALAAVRAVREGLKP